MIKTSYEKTVSAFYVWNSRVTKLRIAFYFCLIAANLCAYLTCLTPFLGGFHKHRFQGKFVWQKSLASSSMAAIICLPSLSVFRTTLYSPTSELLLHPDTLLSLMMANRKRKMVSNQNLGKNWGILDIVLE